MLRAAGHDAPVTLEVRLADGDSATERTVFAHGSLDRRDLGITAPGFLIRREVKLEIRATLTCR